MIAENTKPYLAVLTGGKLPAHASAARDALADIVKQLDAGTSPESLGRLVTQIGAMMERKI